MKIKWKITIIVFTECIEKLHSSKYFNFRLNIKGEFYWTLKKELVPFLPQVFQKCEEEGTFFFLINLFIYFWLCWVFVSVRGLSPVVASGGHSSSRCSGLSLSRPLLLWSIGSRRAGSVIVAHGPSCSAACGIFPDQGSNPCPLRWQADSQPLYHKGSPEICFNIILLDM